MKKLLILLLLASCSSAHLTNQEQQQPVRASVTSDVRLKYAVHYGLNGLVKFNTAPLCNAGFINAIDSVGIEYFRYPGGTNANYANWRTDSPSLKSLQMLRTVTGCNIIFDLNVLTSTISEQIGMLDSANKLGLITDATIYELGNELNQFNYDGKNKFPDAKAYAGFCKQWISEITKRFPKAMFALVGENKGWKGAESWAQTMLSTNPGVFLVWHYYYPYKISVNGKVDTNGIRSAMQSDYKYCFGGISPAKVIVTEFSINDHDRDAAKYLDTLTDDQAKVAVKCMLQQFTSMGIPVIIKHNVVSGKETSYPAVYADKHAAYLEPAGIAMREFIISKKQQQ